MKGRYKMKKVKVYHKTKDGTVGLIDEVEVPEWFRPQDYINDLMATAQDEKDVDYAIWLKNSGEIIFEEV